MGNDLTATAADREDDPLSPAEVALLCRVVRACIIPEKDLVSSWGMGQWASIALDGLLGWELVSRRDHVDEFVGQEGFPTKPGPWIVPTESGRKRMPDELDVAFPPSGNWLSYERVPLNAQSPDLLLQLLEYVFARDGLIRPSPEADIRPPEVLRRRLQERLDDIRRSGDRLDA